MQFVYLIERQPRNRVLISASILLVLCGWVDILTPWQYTLLGFYCALVFVIAVHFPLRFSAGFTIIAALVVMAAELDNIAIYGMGGYVWLEINRFCGLLFAAGCGISLRNSRDEARRRLQAMERNRELEREIVRAAELEQMRISQELHDGVCQTLAALDCATSCLRIDLRAAGSSRSEQADEIQKGISSVTLEARNLARGIYPPALDAGSLSVSLAGLVKSMNALGRDEIVFQAIDDVVIQDPGIAVHLYRITQEALGNAMRHANATRVSVTMEREGQQLRISVADNGCGSGIRRKPDGIGLRTMRYRANLIGASLEMGSLPNGGTVICCTLPL